MESFRMELFKKLPITMVHLTAKNANLNTLAPGAKWAVVNILLKKHPMKIFGPGIVFTWVKSYKS